MSLDEGRNHRKPPWKSWEIMENPWFYAMVSVENLPFSKHPKLRSVPPVGLDPGLARCGLSSRKNGFN